MKAADLLFTTERRIRAPWRIVLFLFVLGFSLILFQWIEGAVDRIALRAGYNLLVSQWGIAPGILAATFVMVKVVEGRSWSFLGLDQEAAALPKIANGTMLGLLPIAVPCLVLLMIGELRYVTAPDGSWTSAAALSLANLLPAAFAEELALRGYIFAVLKESVGARWTLISTSVIFGLLHIPNPGSDAQSILIVMLAGFFLGSVFLATRSLYAATVAHFVWNWFMAAGLHAPVSGIAVSTPDYKVIDAGPDWLTGGMWGPEGGFAAAVGMFAVLIYLHARPLSRMES